MLNKEISENLLSAIIEQFDGINPDKSGLDKLTHQIIQIAAKISVVAIQEYEKLNQQTASPNSPIQ